MLASLLPGWRTGHPAGRCWVRPDRRDWLTGLGLATARDFLSLPGVVVSGHVGRNVSRIDLGGTTAYLKREHRVRWRDRFRSWCDGFGWASMSAREAAVLARLEKHGLTGPMGLAFGEADGQGFLLVEAADGAMDLRTLGVVTGDLATRIGIAVARLHAAGIDQPDLFAKHFLVRSDDWSLTILDWQRAVLRVRVRWPNRVRSLAALRATAPDGLFPDSVWDRLLSAYCTVVARVGQTPTDPARFAAKVQFETNRLLARRGIRSQRAGSAPVVQELVRFDGETVCAIPEVADLIGRDLPVAFLYNVARNGETVQLPCGRTGALRVGRYRHPFGRWWAALRGRSWRSPELQAARLLFHLERHGIPAPKLLAYGQTLPRFAPASSFLLSEPTPAAGLGPHDRQGARDLLDQLHAAGCVLTDLGAAGEPFGVIDSRVVIRDVSRLRLCKRLTRHRIAHDRSLIDAFVRGPR